MAEHYVFLREDGTYMDLGEVGDDDVTALASIARQMFRGEGGWLTTAHFDDGRFILAEVPVFPDRDPAYVEALQRWVLS